MGTIGSSDFATTKKDLLLKTKSNREPALIKILFLYKKEWDAKVSGTQWVLTVVEQE